MRQVVNMADAERQASDEPPSPKTPHPRLALSQILSLSKGAVPKGSPAHAHAESYFLSFGHHE
jgi:hypothetical protein